MFTTSSAILEVQWKTMPRSQVLIVRKETKTHASTDAGEQETYTTVKDISNSNLYRNRYEGSTAQ